MDTHFFILLMAFIPIIYRINKRMYELEQKINRLCRVENSQSKIVLNGCRPPAFDRKLQERN